jgi:hypothetical protein
MANIKPITLEIDEEIWNKFKDKTPRSKTLNDALVELIKQYIYKK